ncbi:MAG: CAP domain-containing protein [Acidimicrobiia bacterium]|nr:CAP domain-containing protein [Acidimicrobiia bacterium]
MIALSVSVASIVTAVPARADSVDPGAAAQEFFAMTNGERANAGVPPLQWRDDVAGMAVAQSAAMAQAGTIWHGPFVSQANLTALNANLLAENVGMGSDVQTIHTAFMNSPHHRENILDAALSQVGIGVVVGGDGTVYVTEDFLHPKGGATPRAAAPPAAARPAAAPAAAPRPAPARPAPVRSSVVAAAAVPARVPATPPTTAPASVPLPQGVVTPVPFQPEPAAAVPTAAAVTLSPFVDGGTAVWLVMFAGLVLFGAVASHVVIRRRPG